MPDDDDAEAIWDDDPQAIKQVLQEAFDGPRELRELRNLLYQLRGEFISRMNNVEETIDGIILIYFGQSFPAEEFRSWILARIQMHGKIEVVSKILRSVGLGEIAPTYVGAMREANEYRNALAHSYVGPDLSKVDDGESLFESLSDLHSIRASKSGVSAIRIDGLDLVDRIKRLKTLAGWSTFVLIAVINHGADGSDALETVRRMESGNPDVPPLT